jgi:hypothetical protein
VQLVAEASTTLTAITIGTDQSARLAWRLQTEATHFGQHFRSRSLLILKSGRLDDRQEFTLQGPAMPTRAQPQPLNDMIRGVLD